MADKFERLQTWNKAKKIIRLHLTKLYLDKFPYYYGDNWPERLKLDELAALCAGNGDDFEPWKILILRSGLQVIVESCRTKTGLRDFYTVSPSDFADFLRQEGKEPSECIRDWFDAFGVEYETVAVGDAGAGSQDGIEPASVKGKTSKSRQKGGQDKLRTSHFIEWLNQNKIHANKSYGWIDYELRQQKPGLWGKNYETFKTWLKTDEAKEAKELLAELRLDARLAGDNS